MDIKKGDMVVVLSGSEKGKTGRVLSTDPRNGMVLVERVRLMKRHTKAGRKQAMQGGIIEKELPLPACKVALVDPRSGKATRVRRQFLADGTKVRIAAHSGEMLDKS
jgi:large subunit ribosomal protein L24